MDKLAVIYVPLIALGFASHAKAEEYAKSYSVAGRANVHVRTDDGAVRVITSDSAHVEFHVKYEGFEAIGLGGKPKINSRQDGNTVELEAFVGMHVVLGISTRRMIIEVQMPKNADLQLETRDGSVEVASLDGKVIINTTDGSIKASQLAGTIDLKSSDGSITVDTLKGDLRLHTRDGAIDAAKLDGKCEASSGDGGIHLAGRFDALDINSGDGSITARAAPGSGMLSSWNIHTTDGSVSLALPADFKANLDASTGDGHIVVDLPAPLQGNFSKSQAQGTINGGGLPLVIRTGDGSIRLTGD